MYRPGASRFTNDATLLNDDTWSASVPPLPSSTEPTLMADEMQPGKLTSSVKPLFPAAMTVAIPTERS